MRKYYRTGIYPLSNLCQRVACLLLGSLLTACVEKDLTIKLPPLDANLLGVLAAMDNGRQPSVLLSRVEPLDDEMVVYPITSALVVLHQDRRPLDTLNLLTDPSQSVDPLRPSVYYSNSVLNLEKGSTYHLTVEAEGYTTATSEGVVYDPVIVRGIEVTTEITDSTSAEQVFGNVTLAFQTYPGINAGDFVIQDRSELTSAFFAGTTWSEEEIADFIRFSRVDPFPFRLNDSRFSVGSELPGGTYEGTLQGAGLRLSGQRLSISITHFSPHYLLFAEPFSRQDQENIGGLGTSAQALPSNISGGFGYFTIRDSQTVFLN